MPSSAMQKNEFGLLYDDLKTCPCVCELNFVNAI